MLQHMVLSTLEFNDLEHNGWDDYEQLLTSQLGNATIAT